MDKFLKKYLNQWGLRGVKGIGGPGLRKSFFILANVVGYHSIFKNGLTCLSTQIIYNLKVKQRNISQDTTLLPRIQVHPLIYETAHFC